MRCMRPRLMLLKCTLLLGGCAVGYNSTLFVTKSNIGIDVGTKPPTAEVSIARREGVLAPGFEGGRTPPVLASFGTASNPFSRFFFGVQSTFVGGDAAVALVQGPGGGDAKHSSVLCLSQKPEQKKFLGWDVSVPEKGQARPFSFVTDTTLGLKIAWSGMTGQFPDTLQLGFNRKEFAWAPIIGTDKANYQLPDTQENGTYAVWMPAFLAVLDNDVNVGSPSETSIKWLQFFATGDAATRLANRDEIRQVMLKRIVPVVYQGKYDESDPEVSCIQEWLDANGDQTQQKARAGDLQSWWKDEKKLGGFGTLLIKTKEFKNNERHSSGRRRSPATIELRERLYGKCNRSRWGARDRVGSEVQQLIHAGATKVECEKQPDGSWTIRAS